MLEENSPSKKPWHAVGGEAVLQELGSDSAHGLDPQEARTRFSRIGPNAIEEGATRTPLRILGAQFTDFMIVVLLAAAAVSGLVGDVKDTIAILVIVVLNAIVGAVQEVRAERAVAALRSMAEPEARVLRGGSWSSRPTGELVPGDVVSLEAGNVVPADLRLLKANDLRVDESPLTGESQSISKDPLTTLEATLPVGDRLNMAHSGTLVTSGRGVGVIVATGMATEIGRIAGLLQEARSPRTPLQRRLARFGKKLSVAVLAICVLIFVAGLARGEPRLLMFMTAVSLAVAAIPEALPAVVTVSLALGASKMTRRNALVRRLPAVETLGSVTVICSDKTGTLTQNRMHVDAVWAAGTLDEHLPTDARPDGPWDLLARAMALNNDARCEESTGQVTGDPTEVALLEAAQSAGYEIRRLEGTSPRVGEVAFEGERRRMTTLHRSDGGAIAFVKGAPETVLKLCESAATESGVVPLDVPSLLEESQNMAAAGYRVLGFAYRRFDSVPEPWTPQDLERELVFVGLVGLLDPPRPEAAEAIDLCRTAGIRPVMITGDHPGTARAIAQRIGMPAGVDEVLTGPDLEQLTPAELEARVATTSVYARVSPEQKIDIVSALQRRAEFVAMTGDGVNDAPALKRAEIGIAMGRTGTEVAREAADMTLLDDNFATIVAAVREGRHVFDNIRKFIKYTMTSNSGEIWTLSLAPFLGLPLPLLPLQILWINLVTDGLPGLAFAVEPEEGRLMEEPPRPPRESIFARGMWQHIVWIGLLIAGLSIGAQAWSYHSGSPNWQTVVFTALTLCQLAHAIAIRSNRESIATLGLGSNLPMLGAVLLTVGLQLAVIYTPWLQPVFHTSSLTLTELGLCFSLPLVVFAAVELEKLLVRQGRIYRA